MENSLMPIPSSLTHQHLFSCLNTLLPKDAHLIRILDAGCGNGALISFIHRSIKSIHPALSFEIYGFDVVDHGVQAYGFLEQTISMLSADIPEINWSERLTLIHIGDAWPYQNNYFDFVLSNQVLEHVHDKPSFFAESFRVLREDGYGLHLFPLIHYIVEGHLHLPWVHRIRSHAFMRSYISLLSLLGLGIFREHHTSTGVSRAVFSEKHADYINFWTSYASEAETLDMARRQNLRASFMFSTEFYSLKIRQILRFSYDSTYMTSHHRGIWDSIIIKLLRYLSGVTLVCEKRNSYLGRSQ